MKQACLLLPLRHPTQVPCVPLRGFVSICQANSPSVYSLTCIVICDISHLVKSVIAWLGIEIMVCSPCLERSVIDFIINFSVSLCFPYTFDT